MLGDTPYGTGEIERLDRLIDGINAARLDFVVHVGDIGSSREACHEDWLQARKRQFARIRHPFVLLPGDNEWADCADPARRLAAWRRSFCFLETRLAFERQGGELCEHVRWEAGGFVFAALNVPGSNNNYRDSVERMARMAQVHAWLQDSARVAEARRGLVVLMQADPFIVLPRDGYADLRERLALLGARMPGKIVLVHGDSHLYRDDEPLPGVRRLTVWGSPVVSWVPAALDAGELRFGAPRYP